MMRHGIGTALTRWLDERARTGDTAPATIDTYRRHLTQFVQYIGPDRPPGDITPADIRTWLASLADDGLQASTRRTRLYAVRAFYRDLTADGGIERDPARQVRAPKVRRRPPIVPPDTDIARVLALAPGRDRVLLVVALQTMLRRAELAGLDIRDVDLDRGRLYVANAKGWEDRWVAVPAEARRELAAWLQILGAPAGPLWPSSHRPGRGLAPSTITHLVQAAGRRAGVRLHPHLLRHKGLTDAAEQGATVWELQRQSGHRWSSSLDVYVHVADRSAAAAMEGRTYRA